MTIDKSPTVVVMEGDQTGQELLDEALRVLAPSVIGFEICFKTFDLSVQNRRATANKVVDEAADAMCEAGLGLKAATITPEGQGDVGSPNAIIRERMDGTVILLSNLGGANGRGRRLWSEGMAGRRRSG
jgi:isocitrate dehydrogenase